MPRPALADVALVGAVAAAAGIMTVLDASAHWPEWLFLTVLGTAVLLVWRLSWRGHRDAVREGRVAARLAAASPEETARRAVAAERRRLAADIETCVRDCLATVSRLAAGLGESADPTPALRQIQAEAWRATTELRRQLGLLRAEGAEHSLSGGTVVQPAARLGPRDYCVAGAVAAVAVVDLLAGARFEGMAPGWVAVTLTLAAAASVLLRRSAPLAGALVLSGLLVLGATLGSALVDGFWLPLATGLLAWTLAARGRRRDWLMVATLGFVLVVSRLLHVPDNAAINAVLMTIVVAGGATVGRSRRTRADASAAAADHERVLRTAADGAVLAERHGVARELHDLVSHAISVIAVQAGAAELIWATDRVAAQRSIRAVATTAAEAEAELGRLLPGTATVRHDLSDVRALVDRMRAAGLTVALQVDGDLPPEGAATVYRVVQEALTNVLRHAPGSSVQVRISHTSERTLVEVIDDGPGTAPGERRGYGLLGLGERLRQVGGTLDTRNGASGFAVTATLPAVRTVSQ